MEANVSLLVGQHREYSGNKVFCLHPRIIVNPSLPELLWRYRCCVIDGREHNFDSIGSYFFLKKSLFNPYLRSYDDYEDCFVLDKSTGQVFPVFLLVPCNHCDLCEKSKSDAFAHRCVLETMYYDTLPWFVTLTYDNDHLPPDGVSVSDCQKFLKRFRVNLVRHGYDKLIRYVCCSEYTPTKGRPHYHLILWNLAPTVRRVAPFHHDYLSYKAIFDILEKSWSKGFVYNEIISPDHRGRDGRSFGSPQKCFEYVSKYITKSDNVPLGKNKNFRLCSNRGGGISAPYLDKFVIPTVRRTLQVDFKFLDTFSQVVNNLCFSRYVLNRCFPTFSSSCPYRLRKAWKDLLYNYPLTDGYRQEEFVKVFAVLSKWLPSPVPTRAQLIRSFQSQGLTSCRYPSCPFARYNVACAFDVIYKYLPSVDFSECKSLALKREVFVGRLLQRLSNRHRDLSDVRYKYVRSRSRLDQRVLFNEFLSC